MTTPQRKRCYICDGSLLYCSFPGVWTEGEKTCEFKIKCKHCGFETPSCCSFEEAERILELEASNDIE